MKTFIDGVQVEPKDFPVGSVVWWKDEVFVVKMEGLNKSIDCEGIIPIIKICNELKLIAILDEKGNETHRKEWLATDEDGDSYSYRQKPERIPLGYWEDPTKIYKSIDCDNLPTWEEPPYPNFVRIEE